MINKIQFLVDNLDSWILPYVEKFRKDLSKRGYICKVFNDHDKVENGDIIILLSCEKKFTQFSKNKFNLVVHESDLPKGKGWSPLTYQILEGKNQIPITLFEADESFDGGKIYLKDLIKLNGSELVDELRKKQAKKTFDLINKFLKENKNLIGEAQSGKESIYRRRRLCDNKLDVNKSIIDNFNILRVSDNNRYPAYFILNDQKYILKISKDG